MAKGRSKYLNWHWPLKAWLLLGVFCLLGSGILSLALGVSRMPWVAALFTDPLILRRALIVHVDLGVSVWFTAFPVAIFFWNQSQRGLDQWTIRRGQAAFALALIGVASFVLGGLFGGGEPLLSNYVPMVYNRPFAAGIYLYFLAGAVALLGPELFKPAKAPAGSAPAVQGFSEVRLGVTVGGLYFLLAVITLFVATAGGPMDAEPLTYYEMVMWGAGHTLQMVNATFMLICWSVLLASFFEAPVIRRKEANLIFMWLGLPLLVIPVLLTFPVGSAEFRQGFTEIMRWGIFPPVLFYLARVIPRALRLWRKEGGTWRKALADIRWYGFFLSVFLILSGFVFGFLIRGADLRVPGHYHAAIGAVSLSYTLMAILLFKELGLIGSVKVFSSRLGRVHAWCYGLGQWVFGFGMVIAGFYGMTRKTYGVEQQIPQPLAKVGMGVMGIGGLFAAIGGALFFILLWRWRHQSTKRP